MEESLMGSEVEGMSNIPDIICNAYGYEKHDAGEYSPLTLAYIGDTIYDLIVRTKVKKYQKNYLKVNIHHIELTYR